MNRDLYHAVAALPGGNEGILGERVDSNWIMFREYPATSGDGALARVWVRRLPAQFFRLTTGDVEITTGSGTEMGELMIRLAEEIARGMIGFATRARVGP